MTSPCPERRSTLYIEPRVELLSAVCPLPIAKPSGGDPVKVSTMVGTGFSLTVSGFEVVRAQATPGADDTAKLWGDPAAEDVFEAAPQYGLLTGSGYSHRVESFRYVHAYGNAGAGANDLARLFDDDQGDDTFTATPEYSTFCGSDFANRAVGFRHVYAYSSGGSDVAKLYDDPASQDVFLATPTWGTLSGGGFFNQAVEFRNVYAYSAGGADVAHHGRIDSADLDHCTFGCQVPAQHGNAPTGRQRSVQRIKNAQGASLRADPRGAQGLCTAGS